MTVAPENEAQRAFWSEGAGLGFLDEDAALEAMHAPLTEAVLAAAGLAPGHRVLDLGCGAGALSRRAARAVGPGGAVWGVDISRPMLERAEAGGSPEGGAPIRYVLADAQAGPPPVEGADRLVSRLGAMFFSDPARAFGHLRAAMAPGGTLTAICWRRGMPDNPFMALPAAVVGRHLGPPEPADPHAPGPMAFADGERAAGLLAEAGWAGARAWQVPVTLTPGGDAGAVAALALRIGPAARRVREAGLAPDGRERLRAEIAAALAPYETAGRVRLPTAMTVLTARA